MVGEGWLVAMGAFSGCLGGGGGLGGARVGWQQQPDAVRSSISRGREGGRGEV